MSLSLHDFAAPPARPGFREELFERAEAAERRAARRWRATALTAIAAVVATTTAAGVLAVRSTPAFSGTYDQTRSCAVPIQGGIPVVRLLAHATYPTTVNGKYYRYPSVAALADGQGANLGGISEGRPTGFGTACTAAPRVPLGRSGLALVGTYRDGDPGLGSSDAGLTCFVGGHVRVRVHTVARNNKPVAGEISMWTGGKRLHPVLFVEWAPKKVTVYSSDDCHA